VVRAAQHPHQVLARLRLREVGGEVQEDTPDRVPVHLPAPPPPARLPLSGNGGGSRSALPRGPLPRPGALAPRTLDLQRIARVELPPAQLRDRGVDLPRLIEQSIQADLRIPVQLAPDHLHDPFIPVCHGTSPFRGVQYNDDCSVYTVTLP